MTLAKRRVIRAQSCISTVVMEEFVHAIPTEETLTLLRGSD